MTHDRGETTAIAYQGAGHFLPLSLDKPAAECQATLNPLLSGQAGDWATALVSAVQQAQGISRHQQGHAALPWIAASSITDQSSSSSSSSSNISCDSNVSSPESTDMSTAAEQRAAQAEQQAAQLAAELAATKQSLASYQTTLHQLVMGVTGSTGSVPNGSMHNASPFAAAGQADAFGSASVTAALNSLAATGKLNSRELSDVKSGAAPSAQLLDKLDTLMQQQQASMQQQQARTNGMASEGSLVSSLALPRLPSTSEGLAYALGGTPIGGSPTAMLRGDSANNLSTMGSRGSSPRHSSLSIFRPASPDNLLGNSGSLFNNSGSMFSTNSNLYVGSPASTSSQTSNILLQQQHQRRHGPERSASFGFSGFDTAVDAPRARGSRSRDQHSRCGTLSSSMPMPVQQRPRQAAFQLPEPAMLQQLAAAGAVGDGNTTGSGSSPASAHGELLMAMNSMNLASPSSMAAMQAIDQAQLMQQLQQQVPQQYVPFVASPHERQALQQPWNLAQQFVSKVPSITAPTAPALVSPAMSPAMSPAPPKRPRRNVDPDSRNGRRAASGVPPRAPRDKDEGPDWRRLFVGNIGWWVDEDALRHWFSDYGTIIDVQVMWNTKLLGKGKKVNREFAFISYSTPEEANTAIHWMHGGYVEGLTKDRDGLTVQYEVQGSGQGAHHSPAAIAAAHELVEKVKSAGYL